MTWRLLGLVFEKLGKFFSDLLIALLVSEVQLDVNVDKFNSILAIYHQVATARALLVAAMLLQGKTFG